MKFFDKLEDAVRFRLSRYPILYALIAGIGTVLFFRGVWLMADEFKFMTGPVTLGIGLVILLLSGSFVYHFIGDGLLASGIKKKRKMTEKIAAKRKREKRRARSKK